MQLGTADQAARLIGDGDTVLITGSGSGMAVPEALLAAIERRFKEEGAPRKITAIHPVGLGNRGDELGASHFAHEGLLKRVVDNAKTYFQDPERYRRTVEPLSEDDNEE